ncbi:MAG TPA: hypothetical protein PKD23_06850 [Bellilinea sp.]|nr:hypothetical protein [Bellilinea sp.]
MTESIAGGYNYRQALNQARRANGEIRESLRAVLIENPTPQRMAMLLARATSAAADNLAALNDLNDIVAPRRPIP